MTQNPVFHFSLRWSQPHTDENRLKLYKHLKENADKFIFQAEDTTDNPHYQGYFHTVKKVRPKQLAKKWNSDFLGIEIQASSTNGINVLKDYAMKDHTRVAGPWADRLIYMGQDLWPLEKMPPWQQFMLKRFNMPGGDRVMHWIYDPVGNNGKTKFIKYLAYKHKACFLTYGDSKDVLNLCSKFANKTNIYTWNLTRAKPAGLSELDLYSAMESVKDGCYINLKYETRQVLTVCPHVMVCANHVPHRNQISADRWMIWELKDSKLVPAILDPIVSEFRPWTSQPFRAKR